MKTLSEELLDRAVPAMLAGVEIYNKPGFPYRDESFVVLAINAWELLLKARWLALNEDKRQSLYVYKKGSSSSRRAASKIPVKRTRSKAPRTHSIDFLAKKLLESKNLDRSVFNNLQVMLEYRNCATHFVNESPAFYSRLFEVGAASVKNFVNAAEDWFQRDLSQFNLPVMPISLMSMPSNVDVALLNAEERNFLAFLESVDDADVDPESRYTVSLNVEFRFTKSKARDAFEVRMSNDPAALEVRLTQENIREKYPWDYDILTERCRQRFRDFKANQKYHDIRKRLEADEGLVRLRYLDPGNPRSAKKRLYNPNILKEFDVHYTKKSSSS